MTVASEVEGPRGRVVIPPLSADPLFAEAVDAASTRADVTRRRHRPARRRLGADPHDFAGLYVRNRSSLELHVRRFLRDRRDVEEVLQEGFLRLFLALPELDDELQALRYCRRVLTNLCIDRYRAAQRRPVVVELDDDDVPGGEEVDPVVAAEDAAYVREALALLSPLHRAALVKWEIEEMPVAAIAEELEIPVENVKYVLYRARRSFRRILLALQADGKVLANGAVARTMVLLLVAAAVVIPVVARHQPKTDVPVTPAVQSSSAPATSVAAPEPTVRRPTRSHSTRSRPHGTHTSTKVTVRSGVPSSSSKPTVTKPSDPVRSTGHGRHHRSPTRSQPAHHGGSAYHPASPGAGIIGSGGSSGTSGSGGTALLAACSPCASLTTTVPVEGSPTVSMGAHRTTASSATSSTLFQANTSAGTLILTQQVAASPDTGPSSMTVKPALEVNGGIINYEVQGSATTITPQSDGTIDVALFSRVAVPTSAQSAAPELRSLVIDMTYGGTSPSSLESEQVVVAIVPASATTAGSGISATTPPVGGSTPSGDTGVAPPTGAGGSTPPGSSGVSSGTTGEAPAAPGQSDAPLSGGTSPPAGAAP